MVLEKSRLLQQIHNLTIGEGLLDKNKSRMSFRANSLEQQYKLGVEESINGSTRDLFYDCEEELYMSGNDSSEEEHSGLYKYTQLYSGKPRTYLVTDTADPIARTIIIVFRL